MSMKVTRTEFLRWARQRTQFIENEMLYPHNPDIADSEEVEIISWMDFASLIYQITEGKIVIKELEE